MTSFTSDNGQEPAANILPDSVTGVEVLDSSLTGDDIFDGSLGPADLDRAYLELAGGTMTGQIKLVGDPVADEDAARKKYVDDEVAGVDLSTRVAVAGDTMTGNLELLGTDPTLTLTIPNGDDGLILIDTSLGANSAEFRVGSGSNVSSIFNGLITTDDIDLGTTGGNTGSVDIWSASAASISQRIFTQGNTQPSMIMGGNFLWFGDGLVSPDWRMSRIGLNTVALAAGDTLQIPQDPVLDNDLSRKKYVDDQITGIGTIGTMAAESKDDYVEIAGDTMTGDLNIGAVNTIQLQESQGVIALLDGDSALAIQKQTGPNSPVINLAVDGDTNNRFQITGGGKVQLGNGTAGVDAGFERSAANILKMLSGDKWQQATAPTVDNDLTNKKYVDDEIAAGALNDVIQYVTAAGVTALLATARTMVFDNTVAATAQLPASPADGRRVDINRRNAGAGGAVTIDGNGKNINGSPTISLMSQYSSRTLVFSTDIDEWMVM